MIVYLATNIVNGKQYVGYTSKSLPERIRNHLYKSRTKTQPHYFYLLPIAIRKYGANNFKWEVLATCNDSIEAQEREKDFIKSLNTLSPNGYNLTEGGNGGVQSAEIKLKISNSVKKYWDSHKEKHSWFNLTTEERSKRAKKAWKTKKENGYVYPTGHKHTSKSKKQMSDTKNEQNKSNWLNVLTGEKQCLSSTAMAKHTNLSVGVFNHLKHGRQKQTKCGWTYIGR